jgi:hypothetical protein
MQEMISMGDVLGNAKLRLTLAVDTSSGGYQNHYRSETYPRFSALKEGWQGQHTTSYFVDNIECADLDAVVHMLNAEPLHRKEQSDEAG